MAFLTKAKAQDDSFEETTKKEQPASIQEPKNAVPRKAYVYILKCSDGTFYSGFTYDVEARVKRHNAKLGAKYTRGRTPVALVYTEVCTDKSTALKREREIKKLTRQQKEVLINKGL